jgi:hypothetical protein
MEPTDRHAEQPGAGAPRTRGRGVWIGTGVIVVVLAVAAVAVGAVLRASAEYAVSGDPHNPLPARLAAAQSAEALDPFSQDYRTRVIMLRGLTLLRKGHVLAAYDLLHAEYTREVIAKKIDPQLAAAHAAVYKVYLVDSSRTAHVQHGKEQTGGVLLPQDVQRVPGPPSTNP